MEKVIEMIVSELLVAHLSRCIWWTILNLCLIQGGRERIEANGVDVKYSMMDALIDNKILKYLLKNEA